MCGEAKQNVKPHMGIFFILISIPKAQSAVRAASRMSDMALRNLCLFFAALRKCNEHYQSYKNYSECHPSDENGKSS